MAGDLNLALLLSLDGELEVTVLLDPGVDLGLGRELIVAHPGPLLQELRLPVHPDDTFFKGAWRTPCWVIHFLEEALHLPAARRRNEGIDWRALFETCEARPDFFDAYTALIRLRTTAHQRRRFLAANFPGKP